MVAEDKVLHQRDDTDGIAVAVRVHVPQDFDLRRGPSARAKGTHRIAISARDGAAREIGSARGSSAEERN